MGRNSDRTREKEPGKNNRPGGWTSDRLALQTGTMEGWLNNGHEITASGSDDMIKTTPSIKPDF